MSIQEGIYSGLIYKIFAKLKIINIYDGFLTIYQFFYRKFLLSKSNNSKVFFIYYTHFTHPDIKKRFYGKKAPLSWSTLRSSEVVHCIQFSSPEFSEKKVIIEPNDHVLVIGKSIGINQPLELVSRSNEISDYIASNKVSRVLIGNNELINHAQYYFSSSAFKKFFIYPEFSCVPKISEFHLNKKNKLLLSKRNIKFLSIASNFRKKSVELLIDAFIESKLKSELTLVCHNVPDNYKKKISQSKNINLIQDIPLSIQKKDFLYKNSDIYINTTCIDGGAVAVNALEYGLPIITHTYHRGKSYIENKNGILISEPMKYYDPLNFGINWNSILDYLEQVDKLKRNGGYNNSQQQLINALKYYEHQPSNILSEGLRSLELAKKNSLEKSNQVLRNLYKQVTSE